MSLTHLRSLLVSRTAPSILGLTGLLCPWAIPSLGKFETGGGSCRIVVARWKQYNTEEEMLVHIRERGEATAMLADLANDLHRTVLTCEKTTRT